MSLVKNQQTKKTPHPSSKFAHKFGGSSLANAERYAHVLKLMQARNDDLQIIVVSAMQGVTDALIKLAQTATSSDADYVLQWSDLKNQHMSAAAHLLPNKTDPYSEKHTQWLDQQFADLGEILHAQSLLGSMSTEALDFIQGLGEVWSAKLLCNAFLSRALACAELDARDVLVVRAEELGVAVDWEQSQLRLAHWRQNNPEVKRIVVTGFVARNSTNRITTLGRNGSDYSGAIFAAMFEVDELHIWTDVDGVLSADPRRVPEAVLVPELSYSEAFELAYFGAKVIHPQTMAPVIARGIPIIIRNTFNPTHTGSRIVEFADASAPVKGITTIEKLAIVTVEGAGMIGVPGTAERVFGALHHASVSVVMISQGSSEHSICCVVQAAQANIAQSALNEEFERELKRGQIEAVSLTPNIAVLAVVGDGMAGTKGVAARVFAELARANVNVRAIAQGASERNISIALSEADATRALRAVHAGFYLSPQTVSIGLIGPGHVGAALLQQIHLAADRLRESSQLDLHVRGISTSRKMVLDEKGIVLSEWQAQFAAQSIDADLHVFAEHINAEHLPHALIIDCSASDLVAEHYPQWLARGIHVITPNKHAGSGALNRYQAIQAAANRSRKRFRYEATVGAGLPIIQTLRDLLDTGDEIISIEGIFSGTLAYLFNRFDGSLPFSHWVRDALQKGYTEPDPRDDLSGRDVARKLVILAREAGWNLSMEQIQIESLVPIAMQNYSREEFLLRLQEIDLSMQQQFELARTNNQVLRHVAQLDHTGRASVRMQFLPNDHTFAHLKLTDNIVQFTTKRYCNNPLVVQGPGAGPEVTAAGVFADILRIAASIGASV